MPPTGYTARLNSDGLKEGEIENLTAGLIGADGQAGGPWVVAGSECRPSAQFGGYPYLQFWPLRPLSPQAVWTSPSALSEQGNFAFAGPNFNQIQNVFSSMVARSDKTFIP